MYNAILSHDFDIKLFYHYSIILVKHHIPNTCKKKQGQCFLSDSFPYFPPNCKAYSTLYGKCKRH